MKILDLYKIFLIISSLFLFSQASVGQERIKINKKEFKKAEEGFKPAWKNLRKGNYQFYQHKSGSYRKAIPLYQKAFEYNAENAGLNLALGICHLRSWPKEEAIKYILKAYDLNSDIHPDIQLFLGKAYHAAGEYNKALIAYENCKESLSAKTNPEVLEKLSTYITQCENGLLLRKKNTRALFENMGENLNSPHDDYNPGFQSNGLLMAFTSRRAGTGRLKSPADHNYFEDIYFSRKIADVWEAAQNAGKPLNSKWNDAFVSLSNDGQKLIFYKGHKNKGDLYTATKKSGEWGYFQSLMGKVNKNKSHESSVCFNSNGTKMYFVSDRLKGSVGGKDIYYSELGENGKRWSVPVNLGPEINSTSDEISVFISSDESTLYFSSNRPQSVGGFDIFKSVFKDGTWSEPENIGIPVNSPCDEIYFSMMPNGRDGFYCSDNGSGFGGFDIYSVTLLGPEKPSGLVKQELPLAGMINPVFEPIIEEEVKISYTRMTVVRGMVTDFNTGQPIESTIELVDNATGKKERESKSDINTGLYSIALPSGKNYGFSVNADGYMFHSENFVVPAASGYKEIFKDIRLQPMTAGSKIILFNTFFETGKSNLRVESYSELNRLAQMFQKYPRLVIEISGHTDNRGSVATNKKISNARAKAVVDFLVSQGVNPSNLKAVGYYFLQPVGNNKTEAGRQQNRRVEAKILSN